jgi:hypothetical protein
VKWRRGGLPNRRCGDCKERVASSQLVGFVAVKSGLKRDAFDLNGAHEVALSFGGLLLFVPGLWGTASVTLSPFWVPVLLLAVQYGTMTGLAAAVAATAVSLTLGEEPPLEDYYAHFLNLWRNPMLWLAAVLVVGAISDKGRGHAQGAAADAGS